MENKKQDSKKRTLIDYDKLSIELKEQLKLLYSDGFHDDLITFNDAKGQKVSALRFETDSIVYMVRMSKELAYKIMDEDDDFDDNYALKNNKKTDYLDKHADNDYLVYSE